MGLYCSHLYAVLNFHILIGKILNWKYGGQIWSNRFSIPNLEVGTLNILLFVLNPWGYGEIVDGFACNHMSKTHFCINDVLLQHILWFITIRFQMLWHIAKLYESVEISLLLAYNAEIALIWIHIVNSSELLFLILQVDYSYFI